MARVTRFIRIACSVAGLALLACSTKMTATSGSGGGTSTTTTSSTGGPACNGVMSCAMPADCPAASTACVVANCEAGCCGATNAPAATPCSDGGGKVCDGAGKCIGCLATSDCKTDTVCKIPACDAAAHTCSTTNAAKGTACTDHAGVVCDGMGSCVAMHCMDSVEDADETDVDCGGASCAGCADSLKCKMASDCASKFCDATMHCSMPTCTDGVKNGNETGLDCGGGTCPACPSGGGCVMASDCLSGVCNPATHTCSAPACTDGVKNGNETGLDCGGGTCPACPSGGGCMMGSDCLSGLCDSVTHTCTAQTIGVEAVANSCYTQSTDVDPFAISLLNANGFVASQVDGAALSTPAGIAQYKVLVFGAGSFSCPWDWAMFDSQLATFVQNGGGVVFTGWGTYYMASNTMNETYPGLASILPVTAGTQFNNNVADTIVPGHPITSGLSNFTNPTYTAYGSGLVAGATPLLTENGTAVAAARTLGQGRVVYLGPIFLANFANYPNKPLLDGTIPSAKQLFINSVAWAAHKI